MLFELPFYFKLFKRDTIVLISFLILFVSISFLVNIGKEMSFPGVRRQQLNLAVLIIPFSRFLF